MRRYDFGRRAAPFLLLFTTHLAIALLYKTAFGLDIESNPRSRGWDWFWQTVPADLLQSQTISSIWHLHSQPPLFNVYGASFLKLDAIRPFQWMHGANILLGSLLSGMMFTVVHGLTKNRRFSLLAGFLLLLNPSLYLYEAFLLYDLLTAFLVVLSIYLLARHRDAAGTRYLVAFVVAVNLLVLTRSVYHLLFLVAAVALGTLVAGRQWKRYLLMSALVSCLSFGWYTKNYVMFGFFGSSSWMGSSLWKSVSANYDRDTLRSLALRGVIPQEAADVAVFSPPSAHANWRALGHSDVPVLSRDDRHNISYVAISWLYLRAAIGLLKADPMHYVRNVWGAYGLFSQPSAKYVQLSVNAARIGLHASLSSALQLGPKGLRTRVLRERPVAFYVFPAALLAYIVAVLWSVRWRHQRLLHYLREEAVPAYVAVLLVYTTAVVCAIEAGENHRLKFMIEQPLWAFVLAMAFQVCRGTWRLGLEWRSAQ